jgi:hypothetical protein
MSKEAAQLVLNVVLRNCAEQDAVLDNIRPLCSQDEFESYRQMIGKSMGSIVLDVVDPIVVKYPDLKPLEMR